MHKDKILIASEVADILQISVSFAYQLLRSGEIPSVRLGRSVRVRTKDLDTFLESRVSVNRDHWFEQIPDFQMDNK